MARLVMSTEQGSAWVDLEQAPDADRLLVIGHGAGGSVSAPDIEAVTRRCVQAGISVARVTQPYRVAGKKAPPRPPVLDAAWASIISQLARRKDLKDVSFAFAGRSSGARVACRCAADVDVVPRPFAVVALAFPVHPPGKPESSRIAELDGVGVPTLVVQGESDPFGMPPPRRGRSIVVVAGDHGLKKSAPEVGEAVARWLVRRTIRSGRAS